MIYDLMGLDKGSIATILGDRVGVYFDLHFLSSLTTIPKFPATVHVSVAL